MWQGDELSFALAQRRREVEQGEAFKPKMGTQKASSGQLAWDRAASSPPTPSEGGGRRSVRCRHISCANSRVCLKGLSHPDASSVAPEEDAARSPPLSTQSTTRELLRSSSGPAVSLAADAAAMAEREFWGSPPTSPDRDMLLYEGHELEKAGLLPWPTSASQTPRTPRFLNMLHMPAEEAPLENSSTFTTQLPLREEEVKESRPGVDEIWVLHAKVQEQVQEVAKLNRDTESTAKQLKDWERQGQAKEELRAAISSEAEALRTAREHLAAETCSAKKEVSHLRFSLLVERAEKEAQQAAEPREVVEAAVGNEPETVLREQSSVAVQTEVDSKGAKELAEEFTDGSDCGSDVEAYIPLPHFLFKKAAPKLPVSSPNVPRRDIFASRGFTPQGCSMVSTAAGSLEIVPGTRSARSLHSVSTDDEAGARSARCPPRLPVQGHERSGIGRRSSPTPPQIRRGSPSPERMVNVHVEVVPKIIKASGFFSPRVPMQTEPRLLAEPRRGSPSPPPRMEPRLHPEPRRGSPSPPPGPSPELRPRRHTTAPSPTRHLSSGPLQPCRGVPRVVPPKAAPAPPQPPLKCSNVACRTEGRHAMRPDRRQLHTCDVCGKRGTAFRCCRGCDYDLCLACSQPTAEQPAPRGLTRAANSCGFLTARPATRGDATARQPAEKFAPQTLARATSSCGYLSARAGRGDVAMIARSLFAAS
mmetsp:Transcript_65470/g.142786  ORF Transcript_65470/g.142786 Transcript_65470/m.142786 type:complete len:703 (-) Transcript_65470:80-2188(-)